MNKVKQQIQKGFIKWEKWSDVFEKIKETVGLSSG